MFPDLGTFAQAYYFIKFEGLKNLTGINWETIFIPDAWMFSYRILHTFLMPLAISAIYWLIKKRWPWPLFIGWNLHILLDMFTHVGVYANEPLFPLSRFAISGMNWASAWIFIPNWIALIGIYLFFYFNHQKKQKQELTP